MLKKFQNLSRGEQNKILLILGLIILAGYFGIRYPGLHADTKFQENMVNRRANRIAERVVKIDDPEVSTVRLSRQLKALEQSVAERGDRLAVVSRRFASLDDIEQIQELKLELSQLAQRSGVYVISMGGNRIVPGRDDQIASTKDSKELLAEQSRNRYERPLTTMKGRTTYVGLMNFLEGVGSLSYNLTVVRLEVSVGPDGTNQTMPSGLQPLEISLLLAL